MNVKYISIIYYLKNKLKKHMLTYIKTITADNKGPSTYKGTNTYILGENELIVIDPGPNSKKHLSNVIDYNMPLKDAVESPRTHHQWLPDNIYLENKMFNSDVTNKLIDLGHEIDYKRSIGEANCIMYDKINKTLLGVSDSRRNGSAIGY